MSRNARLVSASSASAAQRSAMLRLVMPGLSGDVGVRMAEDLSAGQYEDFLDAWVAAGRDAVAKHQAKKE